MSAWAAAAAAAAGALGHFGARRNMKTGMAWEQMMRKTKYQDTMTDMKAAGLNPILAYQQGGGGGSSAPSASGGPDLDGVSSAYLQENQMKEQQALMKKDSQKKDSEITLNDALRLQATSTRELNDSNSAWNAEKIVGEKTRNAILELERKLKKDHGDSIIGRQVDSVIKTIKSGAKSLSDPAARAEKKYLPKPKFKSQADYWRSKGKGKSEPKKPVKKKRKFKKSDAYRKHQPFGEP